MTQPLHTEYRLYAVNILMRNCAMADFFMFGVMNYEFGFAKRYTPMIAHLASNATKSLITASLGEHHH